MTRPEHADVFGRLAVVLALVVISAAAGACGPAAAAPAPGSVYSPARETLGAAVNDFFRIRPVAPQPFPFPHKTHFDKKIACTDYCHESVTKGPVAGLPSIKTCMICHESIATDRPLIQQVTAQSKTGIDFDWKRVYGYAQEAHVHFNHAPHIRAKVECSTCHGAIDQQTTAQRNVDLKMGFCVDCHRSKQAPNECLTCHF
jgi:hypothetical protein